jgi:lipopolysaccharide/colanic/teichoic acid biosynthesis glycosyltransferase
LILSVRPGITDRAAIEFRDEERLLAESPDPERTYVDITIKQRYLAYVARVAGDLRILFDTLRAMFD